MSADKTSITKLRRMRADRRWAEEQDRSRKTIAHSGFWFFISTRLLCGFMFASLLVYVYLDLQIRHTFSSNIQSEPAHVYARPLEIRPGSHLSAEQLIAILKRQGYRPAANIKAPGEFARVGDIVDLYLRESTNQTARKTDHQADHQAAAAMRINLQGGVVQSIINHSTARKRAQVILDPPLIGSLQLGPYRDRIRLQLHEIPVLLIRALLVMEDRNFESHSGVDPKAILRALWFNLIKGKAVQGGSTLTQQLVKNLFLSPERTLSRKALEACLAIAMEIRFSKQEILELYINEIFLGQSGNRAVHGFALASDFYFGRSLLELKVHEIAMLVGMIPAPSYYNPHRHPERAKRVRNLVLNNLRLSGAISRANADSLAKKDLGVIAHPTITTSDFPTYVDYLHRQLRRYYAEDVLRTGGLNLYTTLDANIQTIAQDSLAETLQTIEKNKKIAAGTLQGAVIVLDQKSGEILSLVGDRVKGYSGFNRALDAQRPIGSLVKPAVYLTALAQPHRYSLSTPLEDSPLTYRPRGGEAWSPQNYDKQFHGTIPLYRGLVHSYNLATVRLGLSVGVDQVAATMARLGIEREISTYPSTLLGASHHTPLEVAQMFQTIANLGLRIPLRSIVRIDNHLGETVARFSTSDSQVIKPQSAFLLDFALKMVVTQGTARGLMRSFQPAMALAGKTGTTDDHRDSWFAGYSGNYLTVVWVGRDDNQSTGLSGASGAMRVWEKVMSQIMIEAGTADATAADLKDIVYTYIDPASGLLANSRCATQQSLPFIKGSEPQSFAPCSGLAGKMTGWFSRKIGDIATRPKPTITEEQAR